MRFLADECCDLQVVRALRNAGHDVAVVQEISPGADDASIVKLAIAEMRILVTEDKDFGQLVWAHGQGSLGVIFLRYPFNARVRIAQELTELVMRIGEGLVGCFVTVQPGRSRIGRLPMP
jgi:predicted nuclease of predicted toxin-antitoxin system